MICAHRVHSTAPLGGAAPAHAARPDAGLAGAAWAMACSDHGWAARLRARGLRARGRQLPADACALRAQPIVGAGAAADRAFLHGRDAWHRRSIIGAERARAGRTAPTAPADDAAHPLPGCAIQHGRSASDGALGRAEHRAPARIAVQRVAQKPSATARATAEAVRRRRAAAAPASA